MRNEQALAFPLSFFFLRQIYDGPYLGCPKVTACCFLINLHPSGRIYQKNLVPPAAVIC